MGGRITTTLLALLLAGCCAGPDELGEGTADERREALGCVTEDAVEEQDDEARRAAAAAARRWLDPKVEPDPALRATAARTLGALRAREDAPLLARRLSAGVEADPSPLVRAEAAGALGLIGPAGEGTLAALRDALRDRHRDVRLAAARELGRLEDRAPETTDALVGALRDEAPEVRLVARRSLRALHDVDLGLDAATWSTWVAKERGAAAPPAGPPVEPGAPPELLGPDEEEGAVGPDESERRPAPPSQEPPAEPPSSEAPEGRPIPEPR